jgi:pyridoxine 5'-phosphate synthase PdxJ
MPCFATSPTSLDLELHLQPSTTLSAFSRSLRSHDTTIFLHYRRSRSITPLAEQLHTAYVLCMTVLAGHGAERSNLEKLITRHPAVAQSA